MRALKHLIIVLGLLLALPTSGPGWAQNRAPAPAAGPQKLGVFEDWTAARHEEGGRSVCYAFTYPTKSVPPVTGRDKGMLTVTQRPTGRNVVSITAGFIFPANADVSFNIDQVGLSFYTIQGSAFAKDNPATVAALQRGRQAISRAPGPRNVPVEHTYSLRGFGQAYAATVKACPPAQ